MTDDEKLREAIAALRRWWFHGSVQTFDDRDKALIKRVCDAAESTLLTAKTVEVWRVEYAHQGRPKMLQFDSEAAARAWADYWQTDKEYACIRVTGPHQQEVPV